LFNGIEILGFLLLVIASFDEPDDVKYPLNVYHIPFLLLASVIFIFYALSSSLFFIIY